MKDLSAVSRTPISAQGHPNIAFSEPNVTRVPASKSQSIAGVSRVLFALCEECEIGVLDLARRTGLSVGTAQRITSELVEADLLSWSPYTHKYSLGKGVLRLANAYTHQTPSDLQRCIAEMDRLANATGETTAVHRRFGLSRVIVAQVESNHEMAWRSDIGRSYPLNAGAASKALLAFVRPEELESILNEMAYERFQPCTPVGKAQLQTKLAQVKAIGVAVSFGERVVGAGGVAAPVIDIHGRTEYVLSVYGPEHRIRPILKSLVHAVRDAAERASNQHFTKPSGTP